MGKRKAKPRHVSKPSKVGFWHMARDVLVSSMNKGHFPLALLGVIFMIMVIKMPSADVSKLVFRVFDGLEEGRLVGYLASVMLLFGWAYHSRWQRRIINDEMKRISRERTEYQERALKEGLSSSDE